MNRKEITIFLALILAVSCVSISLAEFDYSIFEEDKQFVIRVDASVGAGNISFAEGYDEPLGNPTSDNGNFHYVGFDILMLPKAPAVIRAQFAVTVSLINAKTVLLIPEETRYTFQVDSNPSTSAYEGIMLFFPSKSFAMIDEILDKQITSIEYLLSGDYDISGEIPVNLESLQTLYNLYKEAGGIEQDFSRFNEEHPVDIE